MHLSVDGSLVCLYLLAIVNDASINIYGQVFVSIHVFNYFEYMPSYGSSILIF